MANDPLDHLAQPDHQQALGPIQDDEMHARHGLTILTLCLVVA